MCCRRRRLYCARINSRRTRRLTLHRISPCIETLYTYMRYILCICVCMCVRLIDISGGRQRTCNWISKISSPLHHFDCSTSLSLSLSLTPLWHTFRHHRYYTAVDWLYIPWRCSIPRNGSGLPSYTAVVFIPRDCCSYTCPEFVTICHMFRHRIYILYNMIQYGVP